MSPKSLLSRIKWRLGLNWRLFLGILLPIVLLPLLFIENDDIVEVGGDDGDTGVSTDNKFRAAYAILVIALYWMFEVLPLAVTAMLPVVLFPFLGVMDTNEVAHVYFNETIVMFFGGVVVALAVECCHLHRRITLRVMTIVGSEPVRLLFGIMSTSMFLSMWMSNTACTAMMLPILTAVLDQLAGTKTESNEEPGIPLSQRRVSIAQSTTNNKALSSVVTVTDSEPSTSSNAYNLLQEKKRWKNIRKMFMFGVAYASNLGGSATITGTGPNLVFQAQIKTVDVSQGGKYIDMSFANWMALNLPAAILNVLLTFTYLVIVFYGIPNWREWPVFSLFVKRNAKSKDELDEEAKEKKQIKNAEKLVKDEYAALGPMKFQEIGVLIVFLSIVVLWIFRDPKFMKGWNDLFKSSDIGDSSAAILGIVIMFMIPKDLTFFTGTPTKGQTYEALVDWKFVQSNFPWGVMLLLGGGFALSEGAEKSGLSHWIGSQLTGLEDLPSPVILLIVMIVTTALTEVCSNVVTANVLLPILLQLSRTIKLHPLYLSVPATIACSFAFMLPVATPPNALVFSTGYLKITDMVSTGLFLNITCVFVYFLVHISLGELLFDYSNYVYPDEGNVSSIKIA